MTNPDDKAYPSANNPGLTKREYFAAMALQGVIASQPYDDLNYSAGYAVYAADSLIKELNLWEQLK